MQKKRLGELLVNEKIITEEQLQEALDMQKQLGKKLGEVLEEQGLITEEKTIEVLVKQLKIEYIDLDRIQISEDIIKLLPEEYAKQYNAIPVSITNGKMVLAMKDPLNYFALEDIKMVVGLKITPAISSRSKLDNAIKKYYGKSVAEKAIGEFVKQNNIQIKDKQTDTNEEEQNAPIMKFINTLIENAIRNKASDIHIEPEENELRIRFRIDGLLRENMITSIEIADSIVSRIKIMCNLDITEKRMPQDGRSIYSVDNKKVDLRISILPTTNGEKIVIRILDKSNFILNKSNLGLAEKELQSYEDITGKPHGIILVTGPTGSGKTSTLYTMLSELNSEEKNIITIEDPVEYNFKGINQVQVNTKTGLTFANGLRTILRQDPDIVMVGEIRDNETAQIAIKGALTGHLVLSTLHTNDSLSTITRLEDMGIEPYLIASTLVGVIAQRLVRKICPYCKKPHIASSSEKKILKYDLDKELILSKGEGCSYCSNSGYKGRMAIFEILEIDKDYKAMIDGSRNITDLENLAESKQLVKLKDSCIVKVLEGQTTIDELIRVTYL